MSRPLRLTGYIVIGIVAGLLVASAAIWLITRTEWGTERARRFAVSWLDERIAGELRIARISRLRLRSGMVLHDFAIIDPKGRPFLAADSVELSYNLRTLLGGEVVIDRAVLHRPTAILEKLPGDTAWNYEYVFPDTTPGPTTAARKLILLRNTRIRDGTAIVRTPIEPGDITQPSDTARVLLTTVPGGLMRAMRFEAINARLDRIVVESPLEKGRLFDVRSLETRGFVWRDPVLVRQARGTVTMRDSIVTFDMPEVTLPGSRASLLGRVIIAQGRNDVDIQVRTERMVFRDMQWFYPALPEEGGGSMVLRIQSQPAGGMLFLAEDARLSAPGTRVAGTFGVVAGGDSLYFTRVDLRASPLDVRLLEQILPGGLPVEGLLIGTVELRGPLSALVTKGDMRLAGAGPGAGSDVSWDGVLDLRDGRVAARSMNADVRRLELALISAFDPGFTVTGSVAGRVQGSGRLDRLRFTGALEHASDDGGRSAFDGGGTIEGTGRRRRIDVTVTAAPATLQDLSTNVPALRGLQGELRGPIHLSGTADDLEFTAALATPGGPLSIRGRALRKAGVQRVTAQAQSDGFMLHAVRPELPHTLAGGQLLIDVAGTSVATLSGSVQLRLDSLRVGALPVAQLTAYGAVHDGVLAVDSSLLRSAAGTGRAHGTLALVADRRGELHAELVSESLTPLEAYLFGSADDDSGAEPRLRGRAEASALLTGWIGGLELSARARGENVAAGPAEAAVLSVELEAAGLRTDGAQLRLLANADSFALWQHPVRLASLAAHAHADSVTLFATAADAAQEKLSGVATVHRVPAGAGDATNIRLDELRIGGASPWRLAAPSRIALAGGVADIDRIDMRHATGARANAVGRLAWAQNGNAGPLDFAVTLDAVPFVEVLRAVRSRAAGDGAVDGTLRLFGNALDPVIEAEVHARDVLYGDVRIDRAFAELSYAALGLDAHAELQHDGRSILTGGGRIPLDLRLAAAPQRRLAEPLRFTIAADSLPPGLPLGLIDGFSNVGGRIDGAIALGGTTAEPSMSGGLRLSDARADWDVSGVRYSDVRGTFELDGERRVRLDLTAFAGDVRARGVRSLTGGSTGGSGSVRGTLDFATLTDPRFDLRFRADRAYAARRRDVEAAVTGEVQLVGSWTRPVISGALRVDEGALYIDELYRQYLIVGLELDDPRLLSLVDTSLVAVRPLLAASTNPFLRGMQVRGMQVTVASDSWLRSRDMDVEVSGAVTVAFDRRDEDLRLTGSLNVERGTYTLYYPPLQSRRFKVTGGSIDFAGTPGIDPNLTITAAYRARAQGEPLDVLALVSGTLQNPRVRLSSDTQPPISESDLASYLFLGVPTSQVANTGVATGDVRAVAGLGARALGPSVLGYASSGLQTLVQGAGLLDYVSLSAAEMGTGATAAGGLTGVFAGTQLELGRYIGSSLFLGYTQRLGAATYDPAARLEWRFLPEYTFELFAEDRLARQPGFGVRPDAGLRKVYGFSLFREWGF